MSQLGANLDIAATFIAVTYLLKKSARQKQEMFHSTQRLEL